MSTAATLGERHHSQHPRMTIQRLRGYPESRFIDPRISRNSPVLPPLLKCFLVKPDSKAISSLFVGFNKKKKRCKIDKIVQGSYIHTHTQILFMSTLFMSLAISTVRSQQVVPNLTNHTDWRKDCESQMPSSLAHMARAWHMDYRQQGNPFSLGPRTGTHGPDPKTNELCLVKLGAD